MQHASPGYASTRVGRAVRGHQGVTMGPPEPSSLSIFARIMHAARGPHCINVSSGRREGLPRRVTGVFSAGSISRIEIPRRLPWWSKRDNRRRQSLGSPEPVLGKLKARRSVTFARKASTKYVQPSPGTVDPSHLCKCLSC